MRELKFRLWLICIWNASIAVTLNRRVRLKVVYVSHTRIGTSEAFIENIQKVSTFWNILTLSTNIKSLSYSFCKKGKKFYILTKSTIFTKTLIRSFQKFFFRTYRCSSESPNIQLNINDMKTRACCDIKEILGMFVIISQWKYLH